ncbi:hypothetical protein AAGV28_07985 [Flavobacterium sp. FZUC8N2.13]|uniref:Uncharacterized protein n=1 Tax=Flavobacterium zubiriense TaxID=3138075 RepID=A0ABV4TB38_9FLAO
MKAIHNSPAVVGGALCVGNYKLKYNFESNSQLNCYRVASRTVGNYKLKYNFESNSQLTSINLIQYGSWEL